jgi:serine/threonine protein kinase
LTNAYKLMGTLPYMSPEQAFAERAAFDHRSDVYSLGATLYELLTLRKLIVAQDPPGILRAIADEQPISPRKLNKAIPRDLENIVLMATQKDPLDRYATAEHFAEDLERFLSGQQALAEQVGLVARGRRWLRRPSRIALVIIFAMNIIAAILLAVWGFQLAKREADLDLRESSRANTRSQFQAEDFGDAAFIATARA